MLIISHRGFHLEAPDNTLEAFRQAAELGVDGIETDVRLSGDDVPVLFHDPLVGGEHDVSSLTHEKISELAGYEVPSLEAAIAAHPGLFWDIEIKTEEAFQPALDILEHHSGTGNILVSRSFNIVIPG